MKKITYMLFIAALVSCKKDKPVNPAAKQTFMSKWNMVYGVNGAYNAYESYTLDANNKLSNSVYNESPAMSTPDNTSYTRNAAGQIIKARKSDGSYKTYEYNSTGQMTKSSEYNKSETLTGYTLFNYSAGGYELASYLATGVEGYKYAYTYTADKKNIAKKVYYEGNGNIFYQTDYTYYTTQKSPTSVYPYSEIEQLGSGFSNQNAVSIATTTYPDGRPPLGITYSWTFNNEGYPLTVKRTYSNGTAPSNTIYEYIVK